MAQMRPPCDSIMERVIASPRPVPCVLVVKNALKILSAILDGQSHAGIADRDQQLTIFTQLRLDPELTGRVPASPQYH